MNTDLSLKNASTEKVLLDLSKNFDPSGVNALVYTLENQNLFSKTDLRGKNILEIGCGYSPASLGIPDHQMPERYVATDPSAELIAAAREFDPRIEYVVAAGEDLPLDPQSFDILVLRGVLHHIEFPKEALMQMQKLLKPGGLLLVYEPNLSCLPGNIVKWILLKFFKINMEESPYGQLPRQSILNAIAGAGYKLQAEWYSSLFAFQLTGDYGRKAVLPPNKTLFRFLVKSEKIISKLLHRVPLLARWIHWRVIHLAKVP